MRRYFISASWVLSIAAATAGAQTTRPSGMVWVAGGEFTMGTDDAEAYAVERPARRVRVEGFWIDETEVTNAQFKRFVDETKYLTVAERAPDWEQLKRQLPPGTPKPPPEKLVPGSLVFTPPDHPVTTDDPSQWWTWTPGACWRHPEDPGSDLEGRWEHPVVHVAWDDAAAYAKWARKRLPTEAEWEYAARGGLERKRYAWGDELQPGGKWMANIWQGAFPHANTSDDGFAGTAPVKRFPPNGYGLYDVTGNVWEWCSDPYAAAPHAFQRVIKGGSFLCSARYCVNYRPSARRGEDADTGTSHIGFRCVTSGAEGVERPGGSQETDRR